MCVLFFSTRALRVSLSLSLASLSFDAPAVSFEMYFGRALESLGPFWKQQVPVCCVGVASKLQSTEAVPMAVNDLKREIVECARERLNSKLAARVAGSQTLQFGFEPSDSFESSRAAASSHHTQASFGRLVILEGWRGGGGRAHRRRRCFCFNGPSVLRFFRTHVMQSVGQSSAARRDKNKAAAELLFDGAVPEGAPTALEVKSAYRKRCASAHPDVVRAPDAPPPPTIIEIRAAYDALLDEASRRGGYEQLGQKGSRSFTGPKSFAPKSSGTPLMTTAVEAAVLRIEETIVSRFLARNA